MSEYPAYKIRIDEDRSWTTNSEFGEYDATHMVIGALLAGAETVTIERINAEELQNDD